MAKKFFWFLSKNKRYSFHFHQELCWTTYSKLCSTIFCHFSGNFIIPSSQNFISFWAKNYFRCLLQFYGEVKFSPLTDIVKKINKWKPESAKSSEYGRWVRTSRPGYDSFCLVIKKTCGLILCIFCWLIPTLSIKCCFKLA